MGYEQLLAVHVMINLLLWMGIQFGFLKVHPYMSVIALLLPFWGVLIVLIVQFQLFFRRKNNVDLGVDKLKLESELYRSITVDEKKVAANTVPIEEALVINSARERRSIIMDVLNDNPVEYISFLQKAGNNEDTEVVHYAVTAMVEISKENDYKLQEFDRLFTRNPENLTVLEEYTGFLWSCLSQDLMQGQVEVLNRELYAELMQKKTELAPGSLSDFQCMVENDLKRKNYALASETLKKMRAMYPDSEAYYLSRLSYLAALGRGNDIRDLLQEIDNKRIFLSSSAKEVLAFWET